jgi:hypothetical protein
MPSGMPQKLSQKFVYKVVILREAEDLLPARPGDKLQR